MKRIFLCCLPWSLTLMTAFAQVDTGTIAGSVRDSSNAFAPPAGNAFGNARRNNLIGPGQNVFDGSLRKEFAVTESQRLEFRAEFFNFFNHPNFAQPDNFIDDGPGEAGHDYRDSHTNAPNSIWIEVQILNAFHCRLEPSKGVAEGERSIMLRHL